MSFRLVYYLILFSMAVSARGISAGTPEREPVVMKHKNLSIAVDPGSGGRIISVKYDDKEFLTDTSVHPSNFGSTLWPSPQALWNWPPPEILDSKEYTIISQSPLKIMSKEDKKLGFQITKSFSISEADTSLDILYTIKNISSDNIEAAAWEITRMPKGGIVCFPKGEGEPKAKTFDPVPYSELNGILWYKNNAVEVMKNHLLSVADGSGGWLAYILDDYIFLKLFDDVSKEKQFDGEGEIPFYVNPEKPYVEVEVQGAKNNLAPGGSLQWKMKWIIRKLPGEIIEKFRNDEVISFIKSTIKNKRP